MQPDETLSSSSSTAMVSAEMDYCHGPKLLITINYDLRLAYNFPTLTWHWSFAHNDFRLNFRLIHNLTLMNVFFLFLLTDIDWLQVPLMLSISTFKVPEDFLRAMEQFLAKCSSWLTNVQTYHKDLCSGWQSDNTICTIKSAQASPLTSMSRLLITVCNVS